MEYVKIPYVDKEVSRIFYGTAGQPFMMGGDANDLLDAIYATGVNAFDTARNYMLAEKSLGKWIVDRGMRDSAGTPVPLAESVSTRRISARI